MRKMALLMITLVVPLLLAAVTFSGAAYAGPEGDGGLDGKQIFLDAKCNLCHGVSSAGIEAKMKSATMQGPDLSDVTERREAEVLVDYLRGDAEIEGAKHKKKFTGSDEELGALIGWLETQTAE